MRRTHYHVFWKDTQGQFRLLCVGSPNSAAAVQQADEYLGESLASVVSVIERTGYWADCSTNDITMHLDELKAEKLAPRQRSLREMSRMPGQVFSKPEQVGKLDD